MQPTWTMQGSWWEYVRGSASVELASSDYMDAIDNTANLNRIGLMIINEVEILLQILWKQYEYCIYKKTCSYFMKYFNDVRGFHEMVINSDKQDFFKNYNWRKHEAYIDVITIQYIYIDSIYSDGNNYPRHVKHNSWS